MRLPIDDVYFLTKKGNHPNLTEAIQAAIARIECYAINNKLSINTDNMDVLLVSDDNEMKASLQIECGSKVIKHSAKVTVLGNVINDCLNWKDQIKTNVIPGLHNRARMIKFMAKYLKTDMKIKMATAVFKSKLLFGIESWGGANLEEINKMQNIQNGDRRSLMTKCYKTRL